MKKKELIINGAPIALSDEQAKIFEAILGDCLKCLEKEYKDAKAKLPKTLDYYIIKLADKMDWNSNKMLGFLNKMADFNPILPYCLLLKEIAIELDKKYDGNIKNSEEIWGVSVLDGSIGKVNKAEISTYNTFAAFRTKGDAEFAVGVLAEQHKDIFGGK